MKRQLFSILISENTDIVPEFPKDKSSPSEPSLQSFIATNLSNNTRRLSSHKPSLVRRRGSPKDATLNQSDGTERNAKDSNRTKSEKS